MRLPWILASVDFERGDELASEALRIAREIGDNALMANTMSWIGNSLYFSGKKQEGISAVSEAVQFARECNEPELLSEMLFTLGRVAEDVSAKIAAFEEMASMMPEPSGRRSFALQLSLAGSLLRHEGEVERAERWSQSALLIARELEDVALEGSILWGLAHLARARGDEAKADDLEAMAKVLLGPLPDLTDFERAAESGDAQGAVAAMKALLGGRLGDGGR